MTINSVTEHYETLQKYSFHNFILDSSKQSTNSISDEFFITVIPYETVNRSNIIENCKKLNDYIAYSTSTRSYNINISFEIINYWLNDQVRSDSDETSNSYFSWYKLFMQKYGNLNSYVSKIYYIDNKLFKKKKELYKLYDDYVKLLAILDPSTNPLCEHLSTIVNKYNNIIDQYFENDNSNLSEVLTHFRSDFENEAAESIEKCGHKILPFKSLVNKPFPRVHVAEYSQQSEGHVNQFQSHMSENVASTFTITLFGTSVGAFLVLIFFYKITLFGYRLRNKKNKNILMTNNLCEEKYELPVYTSEAHDRNSEYSKYNVMYQSLEN
ncbi:PIR protein [Plasmodium ovale]|uniref:PIR Superfamily Protein n=2 Tax=Plasmodium ovale TaxID=36330 RepID=A0A1A8WE91_PLAOA|nr:PIR Superfamily Protein [Plasmodium ovale curtisi]SBT02348.1 PIR Superfamily Protein [Plasmodium ovale curtisi]SBT83391.1 PIR protein [Plasmodium ovale]